jgi:hypothetical protein
VFTIARALATTARERSRGTSVALCTGMRTFTLVSLSVFSLVACGGSEASSPSPPSPDGGADAAPTTTDPGPDTDPGAFCAHIFGAMIATVDRCCAAPDDAAAFKAARDYLSQLKQGCDGLYTASIAKGRLVATDAQASCFAAADAKITNAACTAWKDALGVGVAARSDVVALCAKAYAGTGDVGAPCALPDECKDGLSCAGYVAATSTTPAIDGKCVPPAALGQSCGAAKGDAGIAFNLSPTFGVHPACGSDGICGGTCYPRVAEGKPCGDDDQCADGTRCLLGVCSRGQLANVGERCKEGGDCVFPLVCARPAGADAGTCAPLGASGDSCASSKDCEGTCTNGKCASLCGSR